MASDSLISKWMNTHHKVENEKAKYKVAQKIKSKNIAVTFIQMRDDSV
jgi:hypothetical protein